MPHIPTLQEAQDLHQPNSPTRKAMKQRKRDARRTAHLVISQSPAWTAPTWKIIKRLKKKHNIPWLRVTLSHQRFSDPREIFNGDLTTKLNANVTSRDFTSLPCNCQTQRQTGCDHCGICREKLLVHRVECNDTGKSCIGSTQGTLEKRMQGHFTDVRVLRRGGNRSDSCARHFARMTHNFHDPSPALLRDMVTFHLIWKGNPLSVVKTFGAPHCLLCQQERLNIFKWMRTKPDELINKCNELCGACRHNPAFHRLSSPNASSTDESSMDEKVPCCTEVQRPEPGNCDGISNPPHSQLLQPKRLATMQLFLPSHFGLAQPLHVALTSSLRIAMSPSLHTPRQHVSRGWCSLNPPLLHS